MCRPEHDKIHRLLAVVVELIEVVLHHVTQLLHITHLLVVLHVRLWITKVTEYDAAQVILCHVTVSLSGQVCKEAVEVFGHVILCDVTDIREQPGTVVVIDKTVVENTERLQQQLLTR